MMRIAVAVSLLLASFAAYAQANCPAGQIPVQLPPASPSLPSQWACTATFGDPQGSAANKQYDTWGAVAVDVDLGHVGGSTGNSSSHRAKRGAMDECAAGGGKSCKVYLTYKGGCAAVAFSEQVLGAVAQDAPTSEQAKGIALQTCIESTHGKCGLVYSACTLPE